MKRNISLLLLVALGYLLPLRAALPAAPPADPVTPVLKQRLDSLLRDTLFERSQVGLVVFDLTANTTVYEHNARQLMRPASNQKMVTAITALDLLGGDYKFRTSLYATGTVADSLLQGHLFIRGGLDPCFGSADMRAFARALSEQGVRRIEGDVYLDASLKDSLLYGSGWCWDDDNPVLSPFLYEGRPVFWTSLIETLAEEGIDVCGMVRDSLLPDSARLIASRTHTIDEILLTMMKDSDNLYAESLFYQMGAKSGKPFAGRHESALCVQRLIKRLGLNPADYRIADGSGLSLYNYVTPELLSKLLRYAYRHKRIYNHLLPALPISGEDGTLRKRMRKGAAKGNIFAKTGTVTGISTLSGYVTAANGHRLCFVIMNQGLRTIAPGRDWQDLVCDALARKIGEPPVVLKKNSKKKR